jgi:hypothetical protein
MIAGVGVLGTISGLIASWFMTPAAKDADAAAEEIKRLLAELRQQIATHSDATPR